MNKTDDGQGNRQESNYWTRRSNLFYYKYVDYLVRALATEAGSLIDVGSANAQYVENFTWIPKRTTLDLEKPYSSKNVAGIEMDFFDFEPEGKYDFAICLQVLEHIPDAKSFARKLFQIADRVLISVPYLWEEGRTPSHVNDPVDLNKLLDWTGREPDYHILVKEPLIDTSNAQRLICYYHPEGEKLSLVKARRDAAKILSKQTGASKGAGEERARKREAELREAKQKYKNAMREQVRFKRLYLEMKQSRTWRYTRPVRKILSVVKNLAHKQRR